MKSYQNSLATIGKTRLTLVENDNYDKEHYLKSYTIETVGEENGQTRTTSRNLRIKIPDLDFQPNSITFLPNGNNSFYPAVIAKTLKVNGNHKTEVNNTQYLYENLRKNSCNKKNNCPTVVASNLNLSAFIPSLPDDIKKAVTNKKFYNQKDIKGNNENINFFLCFRERYV